MRRIKLALNVFIPLEKPLQRYPPLLRQLIPPCLNSLSQRSDLLLLARSDIFLGAKHVSLTFLFIIFELRLLKFVSLRLDLVSIFVIFRPGEMLLNPSVV